TPSLDAPAQPVSQFQLTEADMHPPLPNELNELESADFDLKLNGFDADAIERMLRPAEAHNLTGEDPDEDR
ncbi:MAG: hypothetical protein O3A00_21670, partial [Planctomycetota bacterium]|nr:hypothetical protein [Planctomycetota bacterium]